MGPLFSTAKYAARRAALLLAASALSACQLVAPYTGEPWDDGGSGAADALPDGCLPIPAHEVAGKYRGAWFGTMSCPGYQPWKVNGQLSLQLDPAGSPASFKVAGEMDGVVMVLVPFKTTLSGSMGCSSLSATLAEIKVYLSTTPYRLNGRLKGTFRSTTAVPRGFSDGVWEVRSTDDNCTASGTWTAASQ